MFETFDEMGTYEINKIYLLIKYTSKTMDVID